jgi:hypothetical protein
MPAIVHFAGAARELLSLPCNRLRHENRRPAQRRSTTVIAGDKSEREEE